MKLEISLKRVNELFSRFEAQVKNEASISKTDLNKTAETIFKPLLNEIYGWNLENANYAEDDNNHPGIDLGDKAARVCIQVTATTSPEKVKHTLRQFIKHEQYLEYDRLIVFFLKEKRSYQKRVIKAFQDIVQDKVIFDAEGDIWDCRNLYKEISNFQIERVNQIREILEANFGGDHQFEDKYNRLHDLLIAQEWESADKETRRLMCEAVGRQTEGWLRLEDVDDFPIKDLCTVDRLWTKYSDGHFGFSIQKQIWQNCGCPRVYGAIWEKFGSVVGWRTGSLSAEEEIWLSNSQLIFDESAPKGHLPRHYLPEKAHVSGGFWYNVIVIVFYSLVSKLENYK
jgi:hypothetical protein